MASANLPLDVVLPMVVASAMLMALALLRVADASLRSWPFAVALLSGLVAIVVEQPLVASMLTVVWLLATLVIAARGATRLIGFGVQPLH